MYMNANEEMLAGNADDSYLDAIINLNEIMQLLMLILISEVNPCAVCYPY